MVNEKVLDYVNDASTIVTHHYPRATQLASFGKNVAEKYLDISIAFFVKHYFFGTLATLTCLCAVNTILLKITNSCALNPKRITFENTYLDRPGYISKGITNLGSVITVDGYRYKNVKVGRVIHSIFLRFLQVALKYAIIPGTSFYLTRTALNKLDFKYSSKIGWTHAILDFLTLNGSDIVNSLKVINKHLSGYKICFQTSKQKSIP